MIWTEKQYKDKYGDDGTCPYDFYFFSKETFQLLFPVFLIVGIFITLLIIHLS